MGGRVSRPEVAHDEYVELEDSSVVELDHSVVQPSFVGRRVRYAPWKIVVQFWLAICVLFMVIATCIFTLVYALQLRSEPPREPSAVRWHGCDAILNGTGAKNASKTVLLYRAHDNVCMAAPGIPHDTASYAYATDHAVLALPQKCVQALNITPNFADKDGNLNYWVGRATQLKITEENVQAELSVCVCGWVILMAGSGGITGKNVRYLRMLPDLGYGVFAPDTMAMPPRYDLRHKAPIYPLDACHTFSSYWTGDTVYNSSCSWPSSAVSSRSADFSLDAAVNDPDAAESTPTEGGQARFEYPYCYSTQADNVLGDPQGWALYYERVFQIRAHELDYLVEAAPSYLGTLGARRAGRGAAPTVPLFLMGQSEGAMAAARYFHPALEPHLAGRVVSSWSCEHNYFSACPAICAGQCDKATPLLNMIGDMDQYFGAAPSSSVAYTVASVSAVEANSSQPSVATSSNYSEAADVIVTVPQCKQPGVHYEERHGSPVWEHAHEHISGSCHDEMLDGGFTHGTTVVVEGASHDISLTSDNLLRVVLAGFLSNPQGMNEQVLAWASDAAWSSDLCYCNDGPACTDVREYGNMTAVLKLKCKDRTNNTVYEFPLSLMRGDTCPATTRKHHNDTHACT